MSSTNIFCKYEDTDKKKTYVITDSNKQPLTCHYNNKCMVGNCQKFIDHPELYQNIVDRNYFDRTSIVCDRDDDGRVSTYFDTRTYNIASFDGNENTYYRNIEDVMKASTLDVAALQQKCNSAGSAMKAVSKFQIDFPDKPLILQDDIKFCKFKGEDDKKYVITDNNNQPLVANKNTKKCVIANFKKAIDDENENVNLYDNKLLIDTDISCEYENDGLVSYAFDKKKYKLTTYTGKDESEFYKQYNADDLMKKEKFDFDLLKRKHDAARLEFKEEPLAQGKLPDPSAKEKKKEDSNLDTTSPLFVALVLLLIITVLFIIAMLYLLISSSYKKE